MAGSRRVEKLIHDKVQSIAACGFVDLFDSV